MNSRIKLLKKNWFGVTIFLIISLALFLRFYNYDNRFGMGYDQAHDAILARFAVENFKIPLVGPFSSAGPFQTGGEWYWFIMVGSLLIPRLLTSPWIFMTLVSIAFIYLVIRLGTRLENKVFGLIVGLLAAVSTAQIAQSINLTNQGPQAICSLLALWFSFRYFQEKRAQNLFFLGFFISLGVSIHLQAVALYSLIILTLIFGRRPTLKSLGLLLAGVALPFAPIFIFELQNDFVNTRAMVNYFLQDQYKIPLEALGRRWLTYVAVFWPAAWGQIIGGSKYFGYLLMLFVSFFALRQAILGKMNKNFLFLFLAFLFPFFTLRYIRTPLFDSYLTFLHPIILLLSAYVIYFLWNQKRILGIGAFVLLVLATLYKDYFEITYSGNITSQVVKVWQKNLVNHFGDEKFIFYDYKFKTRDISAPLVLYMFYDKRIDDEGLALGVGLSTVKDKIETDVLLGNEDEYQIFDLSGKSSTTLKKEGWIPMSPSYIYESTQNWR